jgi:hypothetical protein
MKYDTVLETRIIQPDHSSNCEVTIMITFFGHDDGSEGPRSIIGPSILSELPAEGFLLTP